MERKLIFLLGGARSGKSTYAEQWARTQGGRVLFVATAQAFDAEMQTRIEAHRAERPATWDTLEVPYDLAATLDRQMKSVAYDTVLIDCLTLLVSNVLLRQPEDCDQSAVDQAVASEIEALLTVFPQQAATWLIVSNEVGMGVVPPTRLGRFYRDALGRANQRVAQAADEVLLLVAGLPWSLKRPE